ncbi:methyltransferase domain-containing protein [Microvirga sp. 2TAF3]|uniref:methyltransferase domain-containing protein n=1 Tax=Microvirga sp. 2TAF3 TaxID=3233014 RepID=UPI003F988917
MFLAIDSVLSLPHASAMPLPTLRSSGDLLADRRYEYARAAFDEKDFEAAADLARQVLDLVPRFAAAHALLGRAEAERGKHEEAVGALRQALVIDPDDALGVRLDLARIGALTPGEAITEGYVQALFDDYAPKFERHLTEVLGYCGPELIVDALDRICTELARPFSFASALDLGCGTGLMAKALKGSYATIEGVDLSAKMLENARKSQLYDGLHQGHLTDFLASRREGEADLVVAADVFIYLAALDPVFSQVHRVLKGGGLFVFTVQTHAGEGVILGQDSRYAHGRAEIEDFAEAAGFAIRLFEAASIREDRGQPVPGFLAILER